MKKLSLLVSMLFILMASIPAVSFGGKGGIGTQDSCAAVVTIGTEDADACGNGGSTIISGPWYENGQRLCIWYNGALSPSVWVGAC